jgi:hypothetical protein
MARGPTETPTFEKGMTAIADSLQPPFGSREQRVAYNESWSRTINEKGAEWKFGREARPHFRCECWQKGCEQDISLSGKDWKLARAKPNRFAVAPNHVAEDFEAVVTIYPHFWLVEKRGEAGEIAEELATQTEVRPSPRDDRLARRGGPRTP